jgi:hypothetical protein
MEKDDMSNISTKDGPAQALTARALKVTAILDPAAVAALPEPVGQRVVLHIAAPGQTVSADIASKALRKAKSIIKEHGADGVAVMIQGRLAGTVITDAGLTAQPKVKQLGEAA